MGNFKWQVGDCGCGCVKYPCGKDSIFAVPACIAGINLTIEESRFVDFAWKTYYPQYKMMPRVCFPVFAGHEVEWIKVEAPDINISTSSISDVTSLLSCESVDLDRVEKQSLDVDGYNLGYCNLMQGVSGITVHNVTSVAFDESILSLNRDDIFNDATASNISFIYETPVGINNKYFSYATNVVPFAIKKKVAFTSAKLGSGIINRSGRAAAGYYSLATSHDDASILAAKNVSVYDYTLIDGSNFLRRNSGGHYYQSYSTPVEITEGLPKFVVPPKSNIRYYARYDLSKILFGFGGRSGSQNNALYSFDAESLTTSFNRSVGFLNNELTVGDVDVGLEGICGCTCTCYYNADYPSVLDGDELIVEDITSAIGAWLDIYFQNNYRNIIPEEIIFNSTDSLAEGPKPLLIAVVALSSAFPIVGDSNTTSLDDLTYCVEKVE